MPQNSPDDIPPEQLPKTIILILAFICLLVIGYLLFNIRTPYNGNESVNTLNECFIYAPNIPYYPEPKVYGSLIDCLIMEESGGNEQALGDAGKAKGCLQFWETTFQMYCVDRYGLTDDIWDCEIQKECADKMLKDNLNNLNHWSVKNLCL